MRDSLTIAFAVLLGAPIATQVFAQTTNPPYIVEMPSVDKVMKAMQTNDPDETAARQMAACTQLKKMVEDIAGPRMFQRGGLTQDELKVRQDYYTAYYNISQSKPHYRSFTAMRGLDISPAFRNELIQKLFPPGFAAEYTKLMAESKQQSTAVHQQAIQRGEEQAKAEQAAGQKWANDMQQRLAANQQAQMPRDPEMRAMYRCVAAGRVPAVCTGNGLMSSLMGNVNEMLSSVAPGTVGKEVTGPQVAGLFVGSDGWRLEFSEASVALSCADMRPDSHAYTIAIVNHRAVLTIASTPKDIVLTLDGETLSAAGPVTVNGIVSEGVHDGIDYTTGKQATIYQYRRVTRNCPRPSLSSKGTGPGVVGMEKNMLVGMFNGGDTGPPTPPGLRMNGTYAAASGFSVGFFPESAIVGCGPDVARAYPYKVIADGKQAVVKLETPDHALTLEMNANNTLDAGSGQYVVQGRRITGQDGNGDFTFAPVSATCGLAVLAPGPVPAGMLPTVAGNANAAGTSAVASAAAAPATAAATARASAASATGPSTTSANAAAVRGGTPSLSTPNAPTGNAVLTIVSGFPATAGARSPLAGGAFILLRDSFAAVVSKAGVTVPAGVTPMKTMAMACANRGPDCQKIGSVVNAEAASAVRADATGKGVFPGVAPGTYYLMISARYNNQGLFWGFKVDLKAGENSVKLDQTNAVPLN